jgi:hypothetical protein
VASALDARAPRNADCTEAGPLTDSSDLIFDWNADAVAFDRSPARADLA